MLTFGIYTYLFVYYVYFFLYPTITMDYTKIGFKAVWKEKEAEAKSDSMGACVYLVVFMWFSVNLLASIIRTIGTSPGNIPEDSEWDMDHVDEEGDAADKADGDSSSEESLVPVAEPQVPGEKLTNSTFEQYSKKPASLLHSSYKYLNTTEGNMETSD